MVGSPVVEDEFRPFTLSRWMLGLRYQRRGWPLYALLALCAITLYLLVLRSLRYRRRDTQPRRYGFATPNDYARMTVHEAQSIQAEYATLESPQMFFSMSRLGLLKVFGIDTISKTVLPQLSNEVASSFRAVSTSLIMSEIICNPPSSERVLDGIARMNYLHSSYIKAGKISNPDMLYILSRFSLEPVLFAAAHDWRPFTLLEKCAVGVFWKDLGDKMGINYACLPSSATGWKDGSHWLDDLDSWSREYELSTMAPSDANTKAAAMATHLAAFSFPSSLLRRNAQTSMAALLEPHQRRALNLSIPSPLHSGVVYFILFLRRCAYKYLLPPRPIFLRKRRVAEKPNKLGRYFDTSYNAYPWYIQPSLSWKVSPINVLQWIAGGELPGKRKFEPEGYKIAELGPIKKKGKGVDFMEADKERMRLRMKEMEEQWRKRGSWEGKGGCPFF